MNGNIISVNFLSLPLNQGEAYALNFGFDRDYDFDPDDEEVDYIEIKHDYVNECPIFDLEEIAGYYRTAVTGDSSWVNRPESKFRAKVWLWNYANRNGLSLAAAERAILGEMARQQAANDAMLADRYTRGL